MKRQTRLILNVAIGILSLAVIGALNVTRNEAHNLITAPIESRNFPRKRLPHTNSLMQMWKSQQQMD